jgi:hypothetical protein
MENKRKNYKPKMKNTIRTLTAVAALGLAIGNAFASDYTLTPDISNPGSFLVKNSGGAVMASYGPGP